MQTFIRVCKHITVCTTDTGVCVSEKKLCVSVRLASHIRNVTSHQPLLLLFWNRCGQRSYCQRATTRPACKFSVAHHGRLGCHISVMKSHFQTFFWPNGAPCWLDSRWACPVVGETLQNPHGKNDYFNIAKCILACKLPKCYAAIDHLFFLFITPACRTCLVSSIVLWSVLTCVFTLFSFLPSGLWLLSELPCLFCTTMVT